MPHNYDVVIIGSGPARAVRCNHTTVEGDTDVSL